MKRTLAACGFSACLLVCHSVCADELDDHKCREAVVKAAKRYEVDRGKILKACNDAIVHGTLPPGTDCQTEPAAAAAIAEALALATSKIQAKCAGDDATCGTPDDLTLSATVWGAVPCAAYGSACASNVDGCDDVTTCVTCAAATGNTALGQMLAGSLDLSSEPGSKLEKCQLRIVRAPHEFVNSVAKALGRCWGYVSSGNATSPCPLPGDGNAQELIDRAETKKIQKLCKACGGADKLCDAAVGPIVGSGGTDDLTPAAIGFAATCPAGLVDGADAGCARTIDDLADIVECIDCLALQHATCSAANAVPWSIPLPASCQVP